MIYELKHPLNADYFQIEHGENFSFPPHMHCCFEVIVVTDGEMEVIIDRKSYFLHRNEAILVFPNCIHSLKTEKTSRHVLCVFSRKLVNSYAKQTQNLIAENCVFCPPEHLISALASLDSSSNISFVKGVLYSLCGILDCGAVYVDSPNLQSDSLLYRIFDYVEKNHSGECTLRDTARDLTYDYAYLSKYFKKNVGMSFNEYVNSFRISEVCYLLATTEKSIIEICGECGYNSLRSLNRNFREQLGVSPAEYRKNIARLTSSPHLSL